jgi:lactate dehydrogenase-like 2-hydroxyacid dehydrogenase
MPVGYHNRRPREGVPYQHFATPLTLAEWCDFLIVATPGGKGTAKLVDTSVLAALGPDGYLVNIARGSVVDTAALIAALRAGTLGGAALDVIDGEPHVPDELIALGNVILTPHIAGRSPEAIEATTRLLIDNLTAHFAGKPVLTPVHAVA